MNPKQQPNIDLSKSTEVVCKCGSNLFQEGYQIREVSKFLIGSERDAVVPVGVFYCVKCFEVPEKFQPKI